MSGVRLLPLAQRFYLSKVALIPHIAQKGRGQGLFAVTTDVTARKREERLRTLGYSVGSLIADAESSSVAMQAVIRAICETERWECGRKRRDCTQESPAGEFESP